MDIPINGVYQSDCFALLERIESEKATLVYIDAPAYPPIRLPSQFSENENAEEVLERIEDEYQEGLNEYLSFLSKVFQQVRRILTPAGNAFIQSEHHLAGSTRHILDQIFGMRNFRGEIIWPNHQKQARSVQLKTEHDTIIHFSKTSSYVYTPQFRPLSKEELDNSSNYTDEHGAFRLTDITSSITEPFLQFEWNGIVLPPGRSWRYSKERLDELNEAGMIVYKPIRKFPALKTYVDIEVGSVWDDILPVTVRSRENLGFPDQRPLNLLERIVAMGSKAGDLVLDPFCGSASTLIAAQKNGRKWLGCDLSAEAYALSVNRLKETLNLHPDSDFHSGDQQFLEKSSPVIYDLYNLEIGERSHTRRSARLTFIFNQPVDAEETLHCEFKEVKGANPIDAIKNNADEYVVAFLNSEGGSIYWGIRDIDRVVVGVNLNSEQRDKLKRLVIEQLAKIKPAIAPTLYRVILHPVQGGHEPLTDSYVVEIAVPKISSKFLYFTGGMDSFIKTDAGKQKLSVYEIHEEIIRRNKE
jgi:DNA modification methylase